MTDHPEELENEGDETIIASQPELYLAALEDRNKEAPPFNRGVDVSADEMPEETAEILDEEDAEEESEDDCTIIAEMPFDGRVGQLVAGRYTIMRIVGEGGMAMVSKTITCPTWFNVRTAPLTMRPSAPRPWPPVLICTTSWAAITSSRMVSPIRFTAVARRRARNTSTRSGVHRAKSSALAPGILTALHRTAL